MSVFKKIGAGAATALATILLSGTTSAIDVVFVPTPQEAVEQMLELANVTANDVVYDLGSGDGRIVVTAAKKYRARAVGYDIDPQRVSDGKDNIARNNVGHLAQIRQGDLFEVDLRPASVVTLYLLPNLNVRLIPQLEKMKPGSRIVSYDFDMEGIPPKKVITAANGRNIYLWETPLRRNNEDNED